MQANWLVSPLVDGRNTAVLPMLPTQLDMCQDKSNKRAASATSIIELAAPQHKRHLHTDTSRHTPNIGIQPIIISTTGLSKEFLCSTQKKKKKGRQHRHTVLSFLPCSPPMLCSIILARQNAASHWRRRSIPVSVGRARSRLPPAALTHYCILPVFAHQNTRARRVQAEAVAQNFGCAHLMRLKTERVLPTFQPEHLGSDDYGVPEG